MYKVTVDFTGVKGEDGANKVFRVGDTYPDPATGFKPTKRRIKYLLSNETSFSRPVIAEVPAAQDVPATQEVPPAEEFAANLDESEQGRNRSSRR